jgi:hypothetical protein
MVRVCDENARRKMASHNSLHGSQQEEGRGDDLGGHGGKASQRQ